MNELILLYYFRFHRKKEPAKTLDYCESRIEDATKLLEENNVTQAYLRLAEVFKKVHMLEKHKEMEKKALDIVINSLGLSANPGTCLLQMTVSG